MIAAHGGRLINRIATGAQRDELLKIAEKAPRLTLNERELSDLEMIGTGAMSPLTGFMGRADLNGVVKNCRLSTGVVWPSAVTLSNKDGVAKVGETVALHDEGGKLIGLIEVREVYSYDKKDEAEGTLGTSDEAHPGMQYLMSIGDEYVAGDVWVLNMPEYDFANENRLTPRETRVLFKAKGWKTIVAFQTRNPIHRAHEYLTKCALELVDGLLIHPLVGATKADDIPAKVRMDCYETLLERYYPKDRVALAVYPQAMRYAGPREAMLHALLRKNYGCTHFIVGRDHAGVGSYYGTYDAQEIFGNFTAEEIGIQPMMFEHAFWDKVAGAMASNKTAAATKPEDKVFLSGTKVREMLTNGERPPVEFTRPEVADILINAMTSKASV
ncbi:MAG: sulfate adenylyltransferase [Planctomycetota bacterium]|nr:MAG: sulfate adenylyltransferase [Planctomycetota bacterium]